ncbi:hypothetical protein BB561_001638 [Smittium simulii]|uniref:Ribosomal RNA-processing protein 42 n=1 Tax=Smittium simulii TaxID=133385 RepID=A0A2T9YTR8_9FUNG|nr:hypothetical protein BB561_001638 [Smittium simulii]
MSFSPISISETDYISKGIEKNFRLDGRENLMYRDFTVVTGVVSQTYGSARCRLGHLGKGSDVLVGIKAEIANWTPGDPETEAGDIGKIVCNVEISPIAAQFFVGRSSEEFALELSHLLTRAISGPQSGLDFKQLCIIPKQAYWVLYVDALVLGYDGNLIDPLLYATRAAFSDLLLPKVIVESVLDEDTKVEHQAFEILDDPSAVQTLNGWENIPLAATFYIVGKRYVIDCSVDEEAISSARVTVTANQNGEICSVQKGNFKTGLSPSLLGEILTISKKLLPSLVLSQNAKLEQLNLAKSDSSAPETSFTFLNFF